MRGLLADVNLQGHAAFVRLVLESRGLWKVLNELGFEFTTFDQLQFPPDLDDRTLWNRCQLDGWVLFTENRNQNGRDSLEATLADSWQIGMLLVLTLANKREFERSRDYVDRVANDVAELLFGIGEG
jgi:hypothetical protein